MKLTKEQTQEIKDQQSQQNQTKRVTAPALENILYEAMPALDHGFVRTLDYMSDDKSIVQSATFFCLPFIVPVARLASTKKRLKKVE